MSNYYRPPQRKAYNWREREAEAARKVVEDEQRKKNVMNETNFPTLSIVQPMEQQSGNKFAKLAEKWAVDASVEKRTADHKKTQEASDNYETIPQRTYQRSRYARHDETYEDQEEFPTEANVRHSVLDDDVGWTEVRHNTYKPKRELTIEEMDERARQVDSDDKYDDFNGELFDSKRHDHDRV